MQNLHLCAGLGISRLSPRFQLPSGCALFHIWHIAFSSELCTLCLHVTAVVLRWRRRPSDPDKLTPWSGGSRVSGPLPCSSRRACEHVRLLHRPPGAADLMPSQASRRGLSRRPRPPRAHLDLCCLQGGSEVDDIFRSLAFRHFLCWCPCPQSLALGMSRVEPFHGIAGAALNSHCLGIIITLEVDMPAAELMPGRLGSNRERRQRCVDRRLRFLAELALPNPHAAFWIAACQPARESKCALHPSAQRSSPEFAPHRAAGRPMPNSNRPRAAARSDRRQYWEDAERLQQPFFGRVCLVPAHDAELR